MQAIGERSQLIDKLTFLLKFRHLIKPKVGGRGSLRVFLQALSLSLALAIPPFISCPCFRSFPTTESLEHAKASAVVLPGGNYDYELERRLWDLNSIISCSKRFHRGPSFLSLVQIKAHFHSHQKTHVDHWLTSLGDFPRNSTNFFRSSVSEIWIPFTLCSCSDSA